MEAFGEGSVRYFNSNLLNFLVQVKCDSAKPEGLALLSACNINLNFPTIY